jgi:hypothetical protein
MRRRTLLWRQRRGATIVEAAFVINICLALLLGMLDFGRVLMTRSLLNNAVREGARLAVVSTNSLSVNDVRAAVIHRLAGQRLNNMSILVYRADPTTGANIGPWTDAGLGECIAVEITGDYVPMVPTFSLLPNPVPMSAKSVMYSEAN